MFSSHRLLFSIFVLWTCLFTACAAPEPPRPPDVPTDQLVILHNGAVVTMDQNQPAAEAIALRGDKILAVGSNSEILALGNPQTTSINLRGRAVLPGFVDAHTHVLNDARNLNLSLDEAQMLMLSNGITSVGDLYVDRNFLSEIRGFEQAGQLRLRTSLYLVWNDPCGTRFGNWYAAYPPTRAAGEMLQINGIKIFTDGGSCGKPALSFELDPGQGLGDLWLTQAELDSAVADAQAAGYQVAIHAIGDRAVEQAQNAIASALKGQPNSFRHRIEHVSVLRPEQIARFGEIGILPVINGQYNSCQPFASEFPEPYQAWEWPWRALRDENPGLPIAWHADYPFLHVNPIVHLYGFVTRKDQQMGRYDCVPGAWLRDDLLTVQESLRAMTIDAAYALFRDEQVGSLTPGKFADVIVLSANPLAVEPDEIKNLKVQLTIVGGRVEYCAPRAQDALCPGFENRVPVGIPDARWSPPLRWGLFIPIALAALLYVPLAFSGRMKKSSLVRWGGVSAMVGGLLWSLLWLAEMASNGSGVADAQLEWVLVYAFPFLLVGLVALQSAQAKRVGRLGWLTFGIAAVGMTGWMIVLLLMLWIIPDFGPATDDGEMLWMLFIVSALATVLGVAFYSLVAWRAKTIPAWCMVPMVLAPVVGLGLAIADRNDLASMGLILFGAGWVAVGAVLLVRSKTIL